MMLPCEPWPMAKSSRELRTVSEMKQGALAEPKARDDDGTGPAGGQLEAATEGSRGRGRVRNKIA